MYISGKGCIIALHAGWHHVPISLKRAARRCCFIKSASPRVHFNSHLGANSQGFAFSTIISWRGGNRHISFLPSLLRPLNFQRRIASRFPIAAGNNRKTQAQWPRHHGPSPSASSRPLSSLHLSSSGGSSLGHGFAGQGPIYWKLKKLESERRARRGRRSGRQTGSTRAWS